MSYQLRRIRHWLVRAIKEADTVAGDRVYPSRFRPVWDADLPAILVFTLEEDDVVFDQAPRIYQCTAQVAIVMFVQATETREDDADDRLDGLAGHLRKVLRFDHRLGKTATNSRLAGWRVEPMETPKRKLVAAGRLTLEVEYDEDGAEGGDIRALDDLTGVRVHYDTDGDGDPDAEDHIPLERPS